MGKIALGVHDVGHPVYSLELAPRVEKLGFTRYWISEHHEAASGQITNPTLLGALVAGVTEEMMVGPGGVLLRYAAPLKVAEDFRLLAQLFPGRIELGLGKGLAPDEATAAALLDGRSPQYGDADHWKRFEQIRALLSGDDPSVTVALTRAASDPLPLVWVLGTSVASAVDAARLGAPYAYSDFFAPEGGARAIATYVETFVPSPTLSQPKWLVSLGGFCSEDEQVLAAFSQTPGPRRRATNGTPEAWRQTLIEARKAYQTDEILIMNRWGISDFEQTVTSYELIAQVAATL